MIKVDGMFAEGGAVQSAEKGMKKSILRYKFNLLSVILLLLVLSLVYQIITGLYGLLAYKHRVDESEQLLQEKLSLVETLESKIQQFESWANAPAPEAPPNEDDHPPALP